MRHKTALGAELVIPALGAALSAYFFVSVNELAWEAKAMGMLVGGLLAGLIVLQLARMAHQLGARAARFSFEPLTQPRRVMWRRLAIVGICALFVFALPWLGITLGIFLLSSILMWVLQAGGWRFIALTSGALAAGAFLLFVALLNTRVPRGPLERLLSTLF